MTVRSGGVVHVTQVDGVNCGASLSPLAPYPGSTTKVTSHNIGRTRDGLPAVHRVVVDHVGRRHTGADFFTHCGADNAPYGQTFTDSSADGSETPLIGSCNIYTSSAGYVNGGVAVDYDPDGPW